MVKYVAISSEISHFLFTLSINYVNPFDIPNLTVSMIRYFVFLGDYTKFIMVCFYDLVADSKHLFFYNRIFSQDIHWFRQIQGHFQNLETKFIFQNLTPSNTRIW